MRICFEGLRDGYLICCRLPWGTHILQSQCKKYIWRKWNNPQKRLSSVKAAADGGKTGGGNRMEDIRITLKNEPRRYMGTKASVIPRGAVVTLIAVINGRRGIVEFEGKRYIIPIRALWRLKRA